MPTPENVSFSIEPQESGKLVYLQLAPPMAGEERASVIAFRLKINNDRKDKVTLKQIKISFPKSAVPERVLERDRPIAAGKSIFVYLSAAETMKVPWPAPASIQVDLVFDGFEPMKKLMGLAPHRSPTSEGSYSFPGRPQDMKVDEYFYFEEHGGGGPQHFGYDIGAVGWNEHLGKFAGHSGPTGDTNESRIAWHKPVHAMADGMVLQTVSGYPDNPRPRQNYLLRRGEASGGAVTAVDVAELQRLDSTYVSKVRMLTAVRTGTGKLKLIVFEQTEDGEQVTRLGEVEGKAIPDASTSEVSVTVVNKNLAVTAVTSGGTLSLTLWSISDDAKTLATLDTLALPGITSVKVARLSQTRILTAARTLNGTLSLSVWKILDKPKRFQPTPMGQASGGKISLLDLVVLSDSRVVTAVATGSHLEVIVWDLALADNNTVTTLARRGDTGDVEAVTAIAACATSVKNQVAAAVRTAAGHLEIFFWNIDEKGQIKEAARTQAGPVTMVTMSLFKKTSLVSAVRLESGTLRLIVWNLDENEDGTFHITRKAEADAGAVGAIALGRIDTTHTTAATVVRDGGGNLKVILWQVARSNGYLILHGDAARGYEAVGYWHMSDMSKLKQPLMSPGTLVKKGQLLGLLGNSGASGGPHLHVHAVKVHAGPAGLSEADFIKLVIGVRDGTWGDAPNDVPYRPLPFHDARAMVAKGLQRGGVWKNPFGIMNGDGVYFDNYAVFPGPATELPECRGIRDQLKQLQLEVATLQKDLSEAGPAQKPFIAAEIKKLKAQMEQLRDNGSGIGCKI